MKYDKQSNTQKAYTRMTLMFKTGNWYQIVTQRCRQYVILLIYATSFIFTKIHSQSMILLDTVTFQTGLNICVILVSEIVWEKYRFGTGFCEPLVVHFPDFSKGKTLFMSQSSVSHSSNMLIVVPFFLACDFCRFCAFFPSPPQRPMTSDFKRFSIPDFIHYFYFPILILEKEPVFSLLNVQC